MERIYHHFGFELRGTTKVAMTRYLAEHPRAGDRVHGYPLEQFGLSSAREAKRCDSY